MTLKKDLASAKQSQRLFERGLISLAQKQYQLPVEVSRGMTILTREGWEAGKVAAVVVDNNSQQVTHILLTRPRLRSDYRLVPVNLIKMLNEETVLLEICSQAVESLPTR